MLTVNSKNAHVKHEGATLRTLAVVEGQYTHTHNMIKYLCTQVGQGLGWDGWAGLDVQSWAA